MICDGCSEFYANGISESPYGWLCDDCMEFANLCAGQADEIGPFFPGERTDGGEPLRRKK